MTLAEERNRRTSTWDRRPAIQDPNLIAAHRHQQPDHSHHPPATGKKDPSFPMVHPTDPIMHRVQGQTPQTALASPRWRGIASSPRFLRRFRELHPWSPVLGLFVTHADLDQLPVFHPAAAVRSDADLAAAARGGDFLLTRLEHDPAWRLRDFRNGRLLLCRGDSLSVYDPVSVSHRHVAVPRPRNEPLPEPDYISDCLLDGHGDGEGGAPCCFRVVTVQRERDGQRMRAMEYGSCTAGWRVHPWVDVDGIGIGIDVPAKRMRRPMHAAAAGLIFWRYDLNSSLLLDTSTMAFSIVPLPVPRTRVYAIGDTDAGACCLLNIVGATMLQV
uniref:DUF1618 domain-containing protein n=1 Tax=Aegilops tauschii TaxID=37682 RepID=M8D680_AEGTA